MAKTRKFKVSVNAFVFNAKNRLLILKRSASEDFLPGYWETPGGAVEHGESLTKGVERETREESGLSVKAGSVFGAFEYVDGHGNDTVNLLFLCALRTRNQAIHLQPSEMEASDWALERELPGMKMTRQMREACRSAFKARKHLS